MLSVVNVITEVIDQHVANYHKSKDLIQDDPQDFIDAYMNKIEESTENSSFFGPVGLQSLRSVILDLFFAGKRFRQLHHIRNASVRPQPVKNSVIRSKLTKIDAKNKIRLKLFLVHDRDFWLVF